MKKTILCILCCFCFSFLFFGCSSNTASSEHSEAAGSNELKEVGTKDYDAIGFDLQEKESLHVLSKSITDKEIIKVFGEPEEKSEAAVWGADGCEHQTWYYKAKGMELGFFRDEKNEQIVFSITLISPCTIKTGRDIGIGSSKEEVQKAYKYEINTLESRADSDSIVAGSVYGGVIFKIENGCVSRIFIGAAAE